MNKKKGDSASAGGGDGGNDFLLSYLPETPSRSSS